MKHPKILFLQCVTLLMILGKLKPLIGLKVETQLLNIINIHNIYLKKLVRQALLVQFYYLSTYFFDLVFCVGWYQNLSLLIFEFIFQTMDESQQEDCTVYIQELKSDNPSLKLNAATKIPVIGLVLGHNRIKEELIPYLIQIIEQMDNDNQFLMKVCEGILELKRYCSNFVQISSLIYPLRVLASLDQPPVRDRAVTCLKKLAEGQDKHFYEQYFYPLINTLCHKQAAYAPKIAACCLIPSAYVNLSVDKQTQLRKLFKSLALEEGGPLIRRAIAENIEDFAKGVDKKIIRGDFYDIWNSLISDTFDIIKIKALQCAVIIARAFKKEEVTQKFFKQIRFVDSGKKSWRVRYSLVQCLAVMLPYLEKDIIKKDVVQAFQELLKDQETQVRAISLIKLPELTQKISQQQAWSVFFQYIQKAGKDANKEAIPTVKLAIVQAIVPFFKTVDKSNVIEAGIPILASLLKDQNQSIRSGVMLRIMELSDIVGPEGTVKYLLPLIQGCINDKKWRFKLAISQNIPNFFKSLSYEENKQFLDKILTTFLKDHNYAVREQTIKSLSASKIHLTSQIYFQLIQKFLNQMIGQPNYIYRVTACIFFRETQNLQKSQINQVFSNLIKKMQNQKISNVLVAFFITYSKIKVQLNSSVKKEFQTLLNKIKEQKQDEDVLYYASKVQE